MSEVVYLAWTCWVGIEDEMRNERDQVMSRVQGQEARRVRRTRFNRYCHVIHVHLPCCCILPKFNLQRRLVLQFSLGTLGHTLGKVLQRQLLCRKSRNVI